MKTVIDYTLARVGDVPIDCSEVKQMISSGWQPSGDMVYSEFAGVFLQPMVKYLEDTEEYKRKQTEDNLFRGRHFIG